MVHGAWWLGGNAEGIEEGAAVQRAASAGGESARKAERARECVPKWYVRVNAWRQAASTIEQRASDCLYKRDPTKPLPKLFDCALTCLANATRPYSWPQAAGRSGHGYSQLERSAIISAEETPKERAGVGGKCMRW